MRPARVLAPLVGMLAVTTPATAQVDFSGRDRVQDLIKKGQSLDQVKAARPSRDYDNEYGNADAFIEAVYRSLTKKS